MEKNELIGLEVGSPARILEHILNKRWKLVPGDKDFIVMWHRFRYTQCGIGSGIHRRANKNVLRPILPPQEAMKYKRQWPKLLGCHWALQLNCFYRIPLERLVLLFRLRSNFMRLYWQS